MVCVLVEKTFFFARMCFCEFAKKCFFLGKTVSNEEKKVANMLNFLEIDAENEQILREYYKSCEYVLCEYSLGTKLMWGGVLKPTWTELAGCLVVRNCIQGEIVYDYPVAGPDGDEEAALTAMENDCIERGIPLVISVVPKCRVTELLARYPYVKVSDIRTWRDYVYRSEDLQNFAGRRYSGQRNHIKKFYEAYPDAEFHALTAADMPLIQQFWADYDREFAKGDNAMAVKELAVAKAMLERTGEDDFRCGGIVKDGKLLSLALAEKCGSTLIIHIEKALYSYAGIYPATVQAFARAFGGDVEYINREDDAANRGLRTSKLQYGPIFLAPKYRVEPQNELLSNVKEIPLLKTERLTMDAMREEDIPDYNRLVLDREWNRLWGYDDVAGLGGPVEERSFFEVAQRDFENRGAVNFAVRLDGKFIGEAVMYRFNYRGDAELGCRILPEYAGHGYGREAFAAAADWGLYQVQLNRIVAKCFHENASSYAMLSSCMRPAGKDETFFYFEKKV